MAARRVERRPAWLVELFCEFPLLLDLARVPQREWEGHLREVGPNTDHVHKADVPRDSGDSRPLEDRVHELMARDASGLLARLGFKTRTEFAERHPGRAGESAAEEGLADDLRKRIERRYLVGDKRVPVVDLLQRAASRLAEMEGNWAGHYPGLLLGEARRLMAAAHRGKKEADDMAAALPGMRISAAERAGLAAPDPNLPPIPNAELYARAINGFHANEADADDAAPSLTAAQATGILLTGVGLMNLLDVLGPAQCLGAPDYVPWTTSIGLPGPTGIRLVDDEVWERSGLQAGMVARLMELLLQGDIDDVRALVYPQLTLDGKSRRSVGNAPDFDARRIRDHRFINKALAMELLSALLLIRIDSPASVLAHCHQLNGMPNQASPTRRPDVTAVYDRWLSTPGFGLVGEVSARREVEPSFYKDQLGQALRRGKEFQERWRMPVYSLVLNVGQIASDELLQKTYLDFVAEEKLTRDGPVRVLPIYAMDLTVAVRRNEGNLAPDEFRFGSNVLANQFDQMIDGLLANPGEDADKEWMCNIMSVAPGSLGPVPGPAPRPRRRRGRSPSP